MEIAANTRDFTSPFIQTRPVRRSCYIVIAGDRGLAGGYNSGVLKLVTADAAGKDFCVLPIGKKTVEFFRSHNGQILTETYAEADSVTIGDCFTMAKMMCQAFKKGEFDEILIAYTDFVSILTQTPRLMSILPLEKIEAGSVPKSSTLTLYEPSPTEVFDAIIPEYLGGLIYGALAESVASEQAARRTAMDSATKNAEEMIADLSLKYNRARQGAITQEITEIVGGSEV